MLPTKTVHLRSQQGGDYGSVQIPSDGAGPEVIRRGDQIFVRRTHGVYHLASCYVVPDAGSEV